MPETACLHIQSRESDPVRVVDLPGVSARVGRAAYCDVRLADPDLADEECRLRRRGGSWQIVPVARVGGAVRVDGRPVVGPTDLPFGTTFQVGSQTLTLRASSTASPWADRPVPAAFAEPLNEPTGFDLATNHRNDWESKGGAEDRWVRAQRETKRWETRWRAAGEKLRAAPAPVPAPVGAPVVPSPRPEVPTVAARGVPRRPDVRPAPVATPPLAAVIPSVPAAPRPAGYVPPAAPTAKREPVRSAGWAQAPVPQRPSLAESVRVSRPVAPAVEPGGAKPVDPPTLLNDLGISRIEHDALDDLISRVQTTDEGRERPTEVVPETPEGGGDPSAADCPEPVLEPPPLEWVPCTEAVTPETSAADPFVPAVAVEMPSPTLCVADGEAESCRVGTAHQSVDTNGGLAAGVHPTAEEDGERDEPETSRPVLGVARRGVRVRREEPVEVVAERTGPDSFQVGATRWVAHRPWEEGGQQEKEKEKEKEQEKEEEQEKVEVGGGWAYQGPFVTDTNVIESVDVRAGAAPEAVVAATATVSDTGRTSRDWPTVGEILAAQGVRSRGTAAGARPGEAKTARRPEPTVARRPGQWRLPIWLAWVPGSTLVLGVGVVGVSTAWGWSRDGYNAGVVARRLADAQPSKAPLPAGVDPPPGSWWSTSAAHLVAWSAYLDRAGDDPAEAEEARALLDRAARLAPLNPTVRYALAHPLPGEVLPTGVALVHGLGQSRDVPALAWAGRALLAAGKKEPALRAFREALEMAARADLTRAGLPPFLDDPQVKRYALPTEDALAGVVREMAGSGAWSYQEWAGALPRGTAAAAIAARVLREAGSPDAEAALDAALADAEAPHAASNSPTDRAAAAVRFAAWAEALAMKQRWGDARDRYRQAVELMPVDLIRRAWWLNIADLASRLNEDAERQKALESAKVADLKDEVTRRAVELQRASGAVARRQRGRAVGTDAEVRR